jgi:hypothetical protein
MKTEEVSNHAAPAQPTAGKSVFWKRRAVVTTSVVLSMLGTGIFIAPTVLTATSMRNNLLQSAVRNDELTATAESATGGWFAPLAFQGVQIRSADDRFSWTVKEIQTSKGLLSFITDPDHVGDIRLTHSSVKISLDDDGKWPFSKPSKPSNSELAFHIENGSLEIIAPWREVPIVEISKLTIDGNIAKDANGQRRLHVDPIQVLDHEPLSESHTQQNLALIAPVLSQSTELSGSASVWLDEINIPIGQTVAEDSTASVDSETKDGLSCNILIRGRAEFHSLEARLKENWTKQLTAIIGHVSGSAIPNQIQVLKDSKIDFSVTNEGIHHSGMVFLLPELAKEMTITSSGSVHLDETIDLLLGLNVPKIVQTGKPFLAILSQLTSMPIQLRVLGTVSEPKLQLPEGMDLLGRLTRQVLPAQHTEESPPLPSTVIDLIQSVGSQDRAQAKKDLPGNILNLIRAVDQNAREKQAERKARRK